MAYWGGICVAVFGILALIASPGRRSTLLSLASSFVVLWFIWAATTPHDACGVEQLQCQQSRTVWDALRMVTIGGPGLLIAIAGIVKLGALRRRAESDKGAAEFWSDILP